MRYLSFGTIFMTQCSVISAPLNSQEIHGQEFRPSQIRI